MIYTGISKLQKRVDFRAVGWKIRLFLSTFEHNFFPEFIVNKLNTTFYMYRKISLIFSQVVDYSISEYAYTGHQNFGVLLLVDF